MASGTPAILAPSLGMIGNCVILRPRLRFYGLWCALWAYRLYIIGIRNMRVDIDASYIKGMLNKPDIQLGATCQERVFRPD